MRAPKLHAIPLLIPMVGSIGPALLLGFNALAAARSWMLEPVWVDAPTVRTLFNRPEGDVLVVSADAARLVSRAALLSRPVVAVDLDLTGLGIPSVVVDDATAGVLAARHLLDRGLRNFAAHGLAGHPFYRRRLAAFRATVEQAGATFDDRGGTFAFGDPPGPAPAADDVAAAADAERHRSGEDDLPEEEHRRRHGLLQDWLRGLPRPVGVMTGCDSWGNGLLRECRRIGLRVPDDVAVVGIDNDVTVAELAFPPLSSVEVPWQRMGTEAALLVERILAGEAVPAEPVKVVPTRVIARRSSDVLAVSDPDVADALAFIRSKADVKLTVPDVLRQVPVYRQKLERAFRRHIGRTIMEEIRRVHVEQAKRLLSATDLPMPDVADRSGFANATKLSIAFRRDTGMPPTAYRRQFRNAGVPR